MAKFCPLFSGSSGNSTYIEYGGTGVLIDAGCSAKAIKNALEQRNAAPEKVKGIFITHEHGDHTDAVRVFASKYGTPVFATAETIEQMIQSGVMTGDFPVCVIDDSPVAIGDLTVSCFKTSHDAVDSCGYVVKTKKRSFAVCTDLGYVSKTVRDAVTGCDVILFESNHDMEMLKTGPYSPFLKNRIMSRHGHLSNAACAEELPNFIRNGATRIVLGHISKENNMPDLAYSTTIQRLRLDSMGRNDCLIYTAPPKDGPVISC